MAELVDFLEIGMAIAKPVVEVVGAYSDQKKVVGTSETRPRSRSRQGLKKGDELIEKERERERTMEMEKEANRSLEVNVRHHKHQHHPLSVVDGAEYVCGSCRRSGHGRRYRCSVQGCRGFEMHRVCATLPVVLVRDDFQPEGPLHETLETFAHMKHGCVNKVYKKLDLFECYHCNNIGKGFRYRCESKDCPRTLHPICAKSPTRINSFMHPDHELELITRSYFAKCAVCNRGRKSDVNNRVYACQACKLYLHPTCSLWPQYLFHELHLKPHPLQLKISPPSSSACQSCKEKGTGLAMYCCETCHESYHPKCLMRFLFDTKADGKPDRAFKEMLERSEISVEFVGIDHLGLIG